MINEVSNCKDERVKTHIYIHDYWLKIAWFIGKEKGQIARHSISSVKYIALSKYHNLGCLC
jgi:hypothetical protein